MTADAADFLGIGKERGRIQNKQWADLIAMKKNPLENIQALREISFVMKNGNIIKFK
jgi:imidazolonepropionase-like amidohydrolase